MKSSKSSNQTFRELAAKAAEFERNGEGAWAANCWLKALEYSNNATNRDWCKARAEFCDSRHYQITRRKAA